MYLELLFALIQFVAAGPAPAKANLIPLDEALVDSGYKEIGDESGVKVFRDEGAKTIVLAAEGHFDSSPKDVFELLLDYPRHAEVVDNLEESSILESGDHHMIIYEKLKLPVINNRDYVLMVRWGQDGDVKWLTFHAITNEGPVLPSGTVRVVHHRGSWQVRPEPDGKGSWARFQTDIDFGGVVPMWMVSSGAADKLPNLFVGFRELLKK